VAGTAVGGIEVDPREVGGVITEVRYAVVHRGQA